MRSSVALKYARALLEVVGETGQEDRVYEELRTFEKVLSTHQELRDTLENPAISFVSRRRVVEQIAARVPLAKLATNFVLVALQHGRIAQFDGLVKAFGNVLDQKRGMVQGEVFSARKLEPKIRRKLEAVVTDLSEGEARLGFHVDPALIGGLKVRIGSEVYDGSVKTQLEGIRRELARE
jgi:F-type H+-transporting ATPase subunit delta